jgi:outer membrane protein assembly factor BamB
MRNILRIGVICVAVVLATVSVVLTQQRGPAARGAAPAAAAPAAANPADWSTFGGSNTRTNANMAPTRITAANVGTMVRQQVMISAPIDAGLIYLKGVQVNGASHDVFFGTTNLGRTVAIDANEAKVLWEFAPPGFTDSAALNPSADPGNNPFGARQISNASPVADANRQFIYAPSADGKVTKISIADGKAVWSTAVTKLPKIEKMDSPLSFVQGRVIAVTAGYVGDAGTYQGHLVILDAASGAVQHVWNSLCSDRHELMDPATCPSVQSAIWGRAGVVVDPATGNLLLATGNGPYNGTTDWSDALIMLDSNATQILGNWTPTNNADLRQRDLDVGSTSPVLLGDGYIAQGGKDGTIRLLTMDIIKGSASHLGGELQVVPTPGMAQLLSASATAKIGNTTWLFAAQGGRGGGGTTAWTFGADHMLKEAWKNTTGGNSPFFAGGLLFVYDAQGGHVRVFDATTGTAAAMLDTGTGHWNSVIVADNRIALPEGAISGFGARGGGGGGRGRGGAGPAGGAPPAPAPPPAPVTATPGIVNIWHLP